MSETSSSPCKPHSSPLRTVPGSFWHRFQQMPNARVNICWEPLVSDRRGISGETHDGREVHLCRDGGSRSLWRFLDLTVLGFYGSLHRRYLRTLLLDFCYQGLHSSWDFRVYHDSWFRCSISHVVVESQILEVWKSERWDFGAYKKTLAWCLFKDAVTQKWVLLARHQSQR